MKYLSIISEILRKQPSPLWLQVSNIVAILQSFFASRLCMQRLGTKCGRRRFELILYIANKSPIPVSHKILLTFASARPRKKLITVIFDLKSGLMSLHCFCLWILVVAVFRIGSMYQLYGSASSSLETQKHFPGAIIWMGSVAVVNRRRKKKSSSVWFD